jgi:hypothetical protein
VGAPPPAAVTVGVFGPRGGGEGGWVGGERRDGRAGGDPELGEGGAFAAALRARGRAARGADVRGGADRGEAHRERDAPGIEEAGAGGDGATRRLIWGLICGMVWGRRRFWPRHLDRCGCNFQCG